MRSRRRPTPPATPPTSGAAIFTTAPLCGAPAAASSGGTTWKPGAPAKPSAPTANGNFPSGQAPRPSDPGATRADPGPCHSTPGLTLTGWATSTITVPICIKRPGIHRGVRPERGKAKVLHTTAARAPAREATPMGGRAAGPSARMAASRTATTAAGRLALKEIHARVPGCRAASAVKDRPLAVTCRCRSRSGSGQRRRRFLIASGGRRRSASGRPLGRMTTTNSIGYIRSVTMSAR